MATNMIPHNLVEVVDAARHLLCTRTPTSTT
jgi:DNA gyrase/topoisomerase IV subunit A